MATPFSDVYNSFLDRVTDYDFSSLTDPETILYGLMVRSCGKFNRVCVVDLSDINTDLKQFNNDLDDEIIDIITTGMTVEWLKPKYYLNENLKNSLNTKDYTTFSPANLLGQIRETYLETKKEFEGLINKYSFIHGDV